MKKIILAYHAYMFGDRYMEIMSEQMRKLLKSDLYNACDRLYIGVVESEKRQPVNGRQWLEAFWKASSSKGDNPLPNKVEIVYYTENREEADTMKWIKNYSKKNPGDYVLYFHTKGITRGDKPTTDWRHYLEYFNIERWRDCIDKLEEGFDCTGVMWNTDTPVGVYPHFSGTFWWANTSYINKLNHSFLDSKERLHREFWIGTNPKAKIYEFHNSGLNSKESLLSFKGHYNVEYPETMYKKRTLHVICAAYQKTIPLRILIDSFLSQTNPNWKLHIVHDGKALPEMMKMMKLSYCDYWKDERINFLETEERQNQFGHPNRKMMIQKVQGDEGDFLLITNDDNYYVPTFVDNFLKECHARVGFVYCNTLHSYMNYNVLRTEVRQNFIDMGSFAVRLDIAKAVGFNSFHEQADGQYAEQCAQHCKNIQLERRYIDRALFIHN